MRVTLALAGLGAAAILAAPGAAKTAAASYTVEPDLRKCPSPLCGGWWVREVNRATTVCPDGSRKPVCYVVDLSYLRAGSDDERLRRAGDAGTLLAIGSLRPAGIPGFPELARLAITRAHARQGSPKPRLTVFSVRATNIVCVTTPCLTVRGTPLNRPTAAVMVSDVDFTRLPAAQRRLAQKAFARGELVAGGRIVTVPDAGPAGDGRSFVAELVYQKI